MKRALKRWWVYLAAVPLADGKSAFRLGRTVNVPATLRKLQEGSPLRVAKIWALPTCSERAALRAVVSMQSELGQFLTHDSWVQMRTNSEVDRQAMRHAMLKIAKTFGEAIEGVPNCWRSIEI